MKTLLIILATSLLLSLIAASLADAFLAARVPIIGDFAGLQYSHNSGIAFGIKLPGGIQDVLILVAIIVVGVIAVKSSNKVSVAQKWDNVAFGLILGGGLANLVDRFRDGVVTDFFQVGSFPIFNVADSCVTVGVAILLLDIVTNRKRLES